MFEHLVSITDQMLGVDDRKPDVVLPEEIGKHLLALHLGKFTEVAVPPKQVECVVDQPVLFARGEFGLEFGEIGAALMDDHHFSVEDRLTGDI
jgi:hypothetical protein